MRVKAAIPYRLAECPEAEVVKPPMRHPRDVKNKVLGLVGFGKIETTVARVCSQAFGMRMKLYDPHFPNEKKELAGQVCCTSLEQLFRSSDMISIHVPLTKDISGIVDV